MIGAVIAAVSILLLAGCPPPGDSDIRVTVTDSGESGRELSRDEIVSLAQREGEVWWYTSLPEQQAQAYLDRFERAYPFINANLVRGSTFDIVRRIDRELARGEVRADSLHVLDPAVFDDLRRRGELYSHDSQHARHLPPEYQDAGQWAAMRAVTICMAYDTSRMWDDETPSSWLDLLDPKWRGRIGLKDAQTGGSAYSEYYLLREQYGVHFWRQMVEQRPQLFRSSADTLRALTSGQIDLAGGILGYSVYGAIENGIPVAAIWPEDGVPMTIGPLAVLSRAPHPHAGIVFMEWALSQEGQQAIVEISGAYSLRDDIAPPPDRPRLSDLNILAQEGSWTEYRTRQDRLQSEYSRLFHPESE
jgi:iron(III) transport system substrate-binding protein